MRKLFFLIFLLRVQCAWAETVTFETQDGRKFENVSLSSRNAQSISVMSDSGITRIRFSEMTEASKKALGYDPAAEAVLLKQELAALRATQKLVAKERRFSRWDNELNHKKDRLLKGPYELYSSGADEKQVNKFKRSQESEISDFEIRLKYLREIVAQYEKRGFSETEIQRLIDAVYDEEVYIGMHKSAVLLSWGMPHHTNTQISASGSSEQLVYQRSTYKADYVYVDESGLVTMIQQ